MPKGRIHLTTGDSVPVSGGCYACFGRYENTTNGILEDIKRALSKRTGNRPSAKVAKEHVSHVELDTLSLFSNYQVLEEASKAHDMMVVVYETLANTSVWRHAFQYKTWKEVVENEGFCPMEAREVSAEYMVSAMQVYRRILRYYLEDLYSYIAEEGLTFGQALFFSIVGKQGRIADFGGDEQIICFGNLSIEDFKKFLADELEAYGMWDTNQCYANRLGYRQTLVSQWSSLVEHIKTLQYAVGGTLALPECVGFIDINGRYVSRDHNVMSELNDGSLKELSRTFPETVGTKLLGLSGKTMKVERVKGKFGSHLHSNLSELIDVQSGLKFIEGMS